MGRYSATAIDPSNPGVFWTFQSFDDDQSAADFNTWGVQATELPVTNFTSDTVYQNLQNEPINVTLSESEALLTPGGDVTITATITPNAFTQQNATTIYLGFSGTAEGNVDYDVLPGKNASFASGAPVEIIIPAGNTAGDLSGSVTLQGLGFNLENETTTLTVDVDQVNLAPPTGTTNTVSLTSAPPTVSLETGFGVETGPGAQDVEVPVRFSTTVPAGSSVVVDYTILQGLPPTGTLPATQGATGALPAGTINSSGSITIAAGQSFKDIDVALTGDPLLPSGEAQTFAVEITSATVDGVPVPFQDIAGNGAIGYDTQVEQYILNTLPAMNTGGTVTLALGANSFPTTGTGDSTTLTATVATSTTDTVVELSYLASGTEGADYVTTGDVIIIPAEQTTGVVTITGNNENAGFYEVFTSSSQVFGATAPATANFPFTLTEPTYLAGGGGEISGTVSTDIDGVIRPEAGVYVFLGLYYDNNSWQTADPAYAALEHLTIGGLPAGEPSEPFVVTNSLGEYQFDNLSDADPPGNNYTVSELVPANYVENEPFGNMYSVNITFSTTTGFTYTNNFVTAGGDQTSTISGFPANGDNAISFVNSLVTTADPAGAVGPSDVIQADNNSFTVYNKTTGPSKSR